MNTTKIINYVEVPSNKEEDFNKGKTTWKDGKCVMLDEGPAVTIYIGHTIGTTIEPDPNNEGNGIPKNITLALPIRVEKPISRDMAINNAEMSAYRLRTAMEVASFNASLSRKSRENANDAEVEEHDTFIKWVKTELTKIGLSV